MNAQTFNSNYVKTAGNREGYHVGGGGEYISNRQYKNNEMF